jgi:hypothetical protein
MQYKDAMYHQEKYGSYLLEVLSLLLFDGQSVQRNNLHLDDYVLLFQQV